MRMKTKGRKDGAAVFLRICKKMYELTTLSNDVIENMRLWSEFAVGETVRCVVIFLPNQSLRVS